MSDKQQDIDNEWHEIETQRIEEDKRIYREIESILSDGDEFAKMLYDIISEDDAFYIQLETILFQAINNNTVGTNARLKNMMTAYLLQRY